MSVFSKGLYCHCVEDLPSFRQSEGWPLSLQKGTPVAVALIDLPMARLSSGGQHPAAAVHPALTCRGSSRTRKTDDTGFMDIQIALLVHVRGTPPVG